MSWTPSDDFDDDGTYQPGPIKRYPRRKNPDYGWTQFTEYESEDDE